MLAQDFTIKSFTTDLKHDLCKPATPGSSFALPVYITSNMNSYYNVSLDRSKMGEFSSWITIGTEVQKILAFGSKTFDYTITIPTDANENLPHNMTLYFKATNGSTDKEFNYRPIQIIVDNSNPDGPSFSVSQTSTSVSIYSWNSNDSKSQIYTSYNSSTGINGIEKYDVSLYLNTELKGTQTFLATGSANWSVNGLLPNTSYRAIVTAYDLAGNNTTTEIPVLTAPTAPVLSSPSATYCSINLQWTTPAGATQYELYNSTNSPATLVTTTSANSFTVTGLAVGKPYKFYVKSINAAGIKSDPSAVFTTSTLSIPTPQFLSGTLNMCSNDKNIEVNAIAGANNYVWTVTSPLSINGLQTYTSSSNIAPVHTSVLIGNGTITVKANLVCGIESNTSIGDVRLGIPVINSNTPLAYYNGSTYNDICVSQTYITNMQLQNADYVVWTRTFANPVNTSWYQTGGINLSLYFYNVNQTAVFNIYAANTCGFQSYDFAFRGINCGDPCNPAYAISPNPASSSVVIVPDIPAPCDNALALSASVDGSIAVYDKQGTLKKTKKYKYNTQAELNVQDLPDGYYILEIFDGVSLVKKNIIVQH